MDFATIGTIGSYVRQKNLTFAANYKIKTGQRIADTNGNLVSTKSSMFDRLVKAQKKSNDEVTRAKLSHIKQKLMNGKKLSETEMTYLREKDPKLYKKAKHADDAREELKADLKKAKTKREAREAVTRAVMKASAEASAELAACKNGLSGGGEVGNISGNTGNIVGGEVGNIAGNAENVNAAAENLTGTENQSLADVNGEIKEVGEKSTGEISETTRAEIQANKETAESFKDAAKEISQSEENRESSSTSDKDSPEGIMEKFIMTIRALEDEWAQFTDSDDYKDLPENLKEESQAELFGKKKHKNLYKVLDAPVPKIFDAVEAYRKSFFSLPEI